MQPEPLVDTERLRLPLWTAEDVAAVLAARGRDADWHRTSRARTTATPPRSGATATRGVRGRSCSARMVVGSIGFFGPPAPATDGVLETEVGYGLVEDARGHGLATEALRALLAEADAAGVRVRASVRPDNAASIRVLAKCGFTELRGSNEDGELVMARPLRG